MLFGLLSALCVVVRLQHLPVIGFPGLFVIFFTCRKSELLKAGGAFLVIIATAGFIDYVIWEIFLSGATLVTSLTGFMGLVVSLAHCLSSSIFSG